ncbi:MULTISPECIES: relaxase/mobilization nuclease domain-containing protein [unclassified Rhodococcus (in: high G+C Gram-positive bacteria)]|uniref:relaxase/mobilization nuclease domain-containing protein n=1 Tax=unclassified Rhodococcus (in: high G+C Gram-positive bacteria) TaxID=192944 RepID=UPI00163AF44D|nr:MULTISPECIES: relaxase/mobilization nuclease domain-containing protein [unclassified Rhodococcus (in: high G+C Gram-positive bacteria)]MBC2644316.1 relaxase/mobilization nuclease domain-containing protein [Rhodococcus sp. 3A]MBC2897991.1 relaxase/mobilization nuclease domain-containing protein [Rhodococcus sp. 4CII]
MIVKIGRGEKMSGLLSYLQGPGRANEHSDPHLVTGDSAIMTWHDDNELSHQDAIEIARQLDQPRRVFGTEVKIPNFLRDDHGNEVRDSHGTKVRDPIDPFRDGNVWHCSLSLHADEGQLTDEKWGAIARRFMDEMGFTDTSGRSPARWIAVRHGLSVRGNDHIHIAASVVREDGTKVDLYRDWNRASEVVNKLEHEHGLAVIESRNTRTGERGYHRAEQHRAHREGGTELDRELLARRVRACATASNSEAEFVRRLRGQGLVARPRFASGRGDVVVGYKVAIRPANGHSPIFYGGGHLAKDLTLPRLRSEWEDSPQASSAAVDEWNAARRERPTVRAGRESQELDPKLLDRATEDIGKWNTYLRSIPLDDRAQWARAAGRTAGVFAAWSAKIEPTPGPLAAAARELARSAQLPAYRAYRAPKGTMSAGGAALIVMQTSGQLPTSVSAMLLLRQLMKAMEAIADAHRAAGELHRALDIEYAVRNELATIHAAQQPRIPVPDTARTEATQKHATTSTLTPEQEELRRLAALDNAAPPSDAVRRTDSPLPSRIGPSLRTHAGRPRTRGNDGNER